MRLVLSISKPWHTNYCTEEGQVLYEVDSPWKLVNRTATIDKIVPNSSGKMMMIEFNIHDPTDRMFTAPDGQEYKLLALYSLYSKLFLNDDARTPVAKYHLKHHGIVKDARPADR
ncbi:hypothetical protein FA15DRAFT_682690 [Coprinopsis marcescibilis]|uniref:Uncharacterized protein n=1 Tax=Coprinopsis marcescibilis TaxID=230819 RepID=A0A5C3KIW6_COPMA|nr:hypothetical protein FA15DRAFT_682690 [Coprinopsis marcescibilis]